ncbi:hypothetical protein [Paenibacillus apiarius]|uniref:hypothetical protein n=1 Tax=Paenibacillus apiarius TaxID=46240 RepID=UPI003B3A629C
MQAFIRDDDNNIQWLPYKGAAVHLVHRELDKALKKGEIAQYGLDWATKQGYRIYIAEEPSRFMTA